MQSISVIIASRGRPWALKKCVDSLTIRDPVQVIVGLDDDDDTRHDAFKLIQNNPGVEVVVQPRQETIHALDNTLAEKAEGDWLMLMADDYWIDQPDWIERLQTTFEMMPRKLGVTFPQDRHYPMFPTLPIVSREMIELNGFFMPGWFPFLFGDTWWHEVGQLCGMLLQSNISVSLSTQHGSHHKLRDMILWGNVFKRTRKIREDVAVKIFNLVYGEGSDEAMYLISTVPERAEQLEKYMNHQFEPDWIARVEADGDSLQLPSYALVKDRAELFLSMTE